MYLIEAIAILRRFRPELVLQLDHIFLEHGGPAVYTAFDALADTPEARTSRLALDTSRLKPRIR
jgi:hypothetical protein